MNISKICTAILGLLILACAAASLLMRPATCSNCKDGTSIAVLQDNSISDIAFDEWFCDTTLRLDYIFAGNYKVQNIYLDKLNRYPLWAGRRQKLNELPLCGNGQVIVRDEETGSVIYMTSFSSLFQEWIVTPEAQEVDRSFENCFQIPMPLKPVIVETTLLNNRHEVTSSLKHRIDPSDILISRIGEKDLMPHRYFLKNGDLDKSIDIAFLAEGYKENEMEEFYSYVEMACDALFEHEPFKSLKDRFNIVAVASPSEDSGVSIPKENLWLSTAFSSHFSTFYSDRYLTTLHLKDVHNALAGIPYEHIIILANSAEYGGGGIYNSYNLSSTKHRMFRPVVVHEFGHSFAGLADEYQYGDENHETYPLDIEPWEKNITTKVDPVKAEEIGNFEGAGYSQDKVFRAFEDCRMRTNEHPVFCDVCQKAIEDIIRFYTE